MEEFNQPEPMEPAHHKRRKRSRLQIFKEAYLPIVIVGVALVFLLVVIIGSVSRSATRRKQEKELAAKESASASMLMDAQKDEAAKLLDQAAKLAANFDFTGAIEVLDSFTGDAMHFPDLLSKRAEYLKAQNSMTAWSDPSKIPILSFQLLIADTKRAFADEEYGSAYNRNYVTTDEFSKILQQLYDNNYILVNLHDVAAPVENTDGTTGFAASTLNLPRDKKPLILAQCAVNYFTYMTDGDGDGLPDKNGDGFACLLTQDEQGSFTNEMIDASGNKITGAFDFVPILENFIVQHPDFSYHGARAVLAVTGYDGIFGYRIDSDTKENADASYYNEQVAGAASIVNALRDHGYEIACYTYDHFGYGDESSESIQADLDQWASVITPVLGDVDTLIYPFGSDIAEYHAGAYEGDTYDMLHKAGFRYFIGMDASKEAWADINKDYFRMTRRLVTGAYMAYSPDTFADLFDASAVLSTARGTVPEE